MLVTFAPTFDKANSTDEREKKTKGESTQNALLPQWGMPQLAVTLHSCISIPSAALPLLHIYRVWQIIKTENPHVAKKKCKKRKWFSQVNWKARNVVMFDLPSGTWCCQLPPPLLAHMSQRVKSSKEPARGVGQPSKRGVCVTRRATFANWMKIFGFSARRQRTHQHTHTHVTRDAFVWKLTCFGGPCDPFELPSNCETVAICSACATHSSLEA